MTSYRNTQLDRFLREFLKLPPEQEFEHDDLLSDLGLDSVDCVNLVVELELEFDQLIPDEDAEKFKTVGDVREFLAKGAPDALNR